MADETLVRSEIAKIDNELETIQVEIEELLKRQEDLTNRKECLEQQLNEVELLQTKDKDWSLMKFEWSKKIEDLREQVFHINEFRPLQRECMNVTISGNDSIYIFTYISV